jgi:hypothetical protein
MGHVRQADTSVFSAHDDFWRRLLHWSRQQEGIIRNPRIGIEVDAGEEPYCGAGSDSDRIESNSMMIRPAAFQG